MTPRQEKWQGSNWIRREKRIAIYARDGLSCIYCGATAEDDTLTLDHLQPVELGGGNGAGNLVTCCRRCNGAKGSRSVRQFLRYLRLQGIDTSAIARKIRRAINKPINYGRKLS